MAEIQIVYREYSCAYNGRDFCVQCMTQCAGDLGCRHYLEDENDPKVLSSGKCERVDVAYKYKGWAGKRYEIEELCDPYNPNLDCMEVTLGNKVYDCVKVILNGRCIYNEFDDESVNEDEKVK